MQVKTKEDQEKLLRFLLILARQLEQEVFAQYQGVMRIQMTGVRELITSMEGEGVFRAYQWNEAKPYLDMIMQPVVDSIAEVLPAKLSLMEPAVRKRAAEFIDLPAPELSFRSSNAMMIKAMSGTHTLDEMLGASGQDPRMVKRYVENIDRVVKIGLLTERPTLDIADDVMKTVIRNGRDTRAIVRGTVANQNLNITKNMVAEVTWDIVENNLLQVWSKEGKKVRKWTWNSVLDPLTCPICGPLDGETADALEDFQSIPPVHPNCRCSILPLRFE